MFGTVRQGMRHDGCSIAKVLLEFARFPAVSIRCPQATKPLVDEWLIGRCFVKECGADIGDLNLAFSESE